jgi:hypothetical protein
LKVQCPTCREIVEMSDFSTSEAGLTFRCDLCRTAAFIPAPRPTLEARPPVSPVSSASALSSPSPSEAADQAGQTACPKCGHLQADPIACHRCGLTFAKFDPQSVASDPPEALALWEKIERAPQNGELHEAFVQRCLELNRPDTASRLYRRLSRNPTHRVLAEQMIERLLARAQARLAPVALTPSDRDKPRRTGQIVVWVVVVVCLAATGYLILSATELMGKLGG